MQEIYAYMYIHIQTVNEISNFVEYELYFFVESRFSVWLALCDADCDEMRGLAFVSFISLQGRLSSANDYN